MERFFGNAYRGDSGVPHSDPKRFANIWIGAFGFAAITWFNPHIWHTNTQWNWHDKAMLYEQYHRKKSLQKKEPYKFKWNQVMDKDLRDSYFFNWPICFP